MTNYATGSGGSLKFANLVIPSCNCKICLFLGKFSNFYAVTQTSLSRNAAAKFVFSLTRKPSKFGKKFYTGLTGAVSVVVVVTSGAPRVVSAPPPAGPKFEPGGGCGGATSFPGGTPALCSGAEVGLAPPPFVP